MLPTFHISKATTADIDALVTLVNSAYRGESSKQGWTTEADLLDGSRTDAATLLLEMQNPNQQFLKAVDSFNTIIGCVSLVKKDTCLYLGMLTVQPTIQAKGIGKALLDAAETTAIALGLNTIEMTVISVRTNLIDWYIRKGYQLTGETLPFPTDPKFGIQKQALTFCVLRKKIHN